MTKKSRRVAKARRMLLTLSLVLVVAFAAVGGTVAWLTSTSGTVTNTFSVGDIEITLQEHDYLPESNTLNKSAATVTANADYKFVPGMNLPKDPYVTVKQGSEASYVFLKVTESTNWPNITYTETVDGVSVTKDKIAYTIDSAWKQLTIDNVPVANVYYQTVAATTNGDEDLNIIANETVYVSNLLTKDELDDIDTDTTNPQLSFIACAVQQANLTLDEAWAEADNLI